MDGLDGGGAQRLEQRSRRTAGRRFSEDNKTRRSLNKRNTEGSESRAERILTICPDQQLTECAVRDGSAHDTVSAIWWAEEKIDCSPRSRPSSLAGLEIPELLLGKRHAIVELSP